MMNSKQMVMMMMENSFSLNRLRHMRRAIARARLYNFHFLYNTKILRENHVYLFFISLVQW